MSRQQHGFYSSFPPPPPPQDSPTSGTSGQPRSRPISRLLPSITTSFSPGGQAGSLPQSQAATPVHGPHLSPGLSVSYGPATPSTLNPQTTSNFPRSIPHSQPTPGSSPRTMEPYNPRQWTRSQVSGSQMVFQQRQSTMPASTHNVTGMEAAMPSPPPPYSREISSNLSQAAVASPMLDNTGFTASPLHAESSTRTSPQVSRSPTFPPPPPQHRERSASGQGQRSFFSLSGLRGKQPAATDFQHTQSFNTAHVPLFNDAHPPAARRAASTGHMSSSGPSSSFHRPMGRESPETRWHAGMPLPGPPPGPPPPTNRSQSLNRPMGSSASSSSGDERSREAPRQRRTMAQSSLGPVPPTPADWVDSDLSLGGEAPPLPPQRRTDHGAVVPSLRIITGSSTGSSSSSRPTARDMSAQGIRERRSRSRATLGANDQDSVPANLVFSPDGGSISRRREHMRIASGYAGPSSAPATSQSSSKAPENVLTPPYTPAITRKNAIKGPSSASSDRPISHLLHTPNEENVTMHAPLSPARPASSSSTKAPGKLDAFAVQAIERHRLFVEKEAVASSDEQRLELFATFLVHESRVRRDRYTAAYNAMAGDIVDLTRDMWRPYAGKGGRRAVTPSTSMSSNDPTVPSWASDGQPNSAHANMPSSASSFEGFTPATDSSSMGEDGFERSEGRQWAEAFKPSLSPIPSMAVSTVPDENDSRGRTASRWWEQADRSAAGSIGRPDRLEKTRRETKYMGVNPAALQAIEPENASPSPGSSNPVYMYGPNEYPPEKAGWHESADIDTPMQTPHRIGERHTPTPGVEPLDVSRLVTLPPPYPRHHPAVNNSHPRLNDLRSEHRLLADLSAVQKIKDDYMEKDFALSKQQQDAGKKRRSRLRMDIQNRIAEGSMSFAEAAKAEADFDGEEAERGKTNARAGFDLFETSVAHPLNTLLTSRLEKANTCIDHLRADLDSTHHSTNPNQAQEEGDEHPERLEKLTLLKWLFEAREQLHKEMSDLHGTRSEKYSEVILTPYRISGLQSKIDEATTFFQKDSLDRQVSFAKASLQRLEELQSITESNVSRGVEDQLSAFWDIAPGLLEVIQQIPSAPDQLARFAVRVPSQEFEENPTYHVHPLQYLYSLLHHAEKSAYQFIESQVNLLCLLHEVRTATMKSRLRGLEIERTVKARDGEEEEEDEVRAELSLARREAEERLTSELKDKVGEVERQWREALGDGLERCRGVVREYLERSGGLDEEEGLEG